MTPIERALLWIDHAHHHDRCGRRTTRICDCGRDDIVFDLSKIVLREAKRIPAPTKATKHKEASRAR
jgi:hypothetical protein